VHLALANQQKELMDQARELKSFNDAMLDREGRVIELKLEVNELAKEMGREEPYPGIGK